jgi:hypothetical protein
MFPSLPQVGDRASNGSESSKNREEYFRVYRFQHRVSD